MTNTTLCTRSPWVSPTGCAVHSTPSASVAPFVIDDSTCTFDAALVVLVDCVEPQPAHSPAAVAAATSANGSRGLLVSMAGQAARSGLQRACSSLEPRWTRGFDGLRVGRAVVDFRVLGPLEVSGPTGAIAVGGRKQRLLLALLLLHADGSVSRAAAIDALWPEDPPASAGSTLESYVSRLRSLLREAGAGPEIIPLGPAGSPISLVGGQG